MKTSFSRTLMAALLLSLAGSAVAKLPAPSPEAKAKAEEAKAKAAWADKLAAYQLCKSQDKVATAYLKGKDSKNVVATPACADPGPYVAAAPAPASVPAATLAAASATVPATAATVAPVPAGKAK